MAAGELGIGTSLGGVGAPRMGGNPVSLAITAPAHKAAGVVPGRIAVLTALVKSPFDLAPKLVGTELVNGNGVGR